jgi:uncharacterized glyoxalase superfamily protein PhnB
MSQEPPITASLFPALRLADAEAALDWLARGLGFAPHAVHRDAAGAIAHAEMRLGNGAVMLGQRRPPDRANPWVDAPFGIYAAVEDVDAHHARASAAGLAVVRPLAHTAYGAREFTLRDPEGRLWSFGTYRP